MAKRQQVGVAALRYRRALVRTATGAAVAGWPIVPGAWWSATDRRFVCDQPGCARTGPHPAVLTGTTGSQTYGEGLGTHALRHPEAVSRRWRRRPYSVLVPTGETCDAVDVPAGLGRALAMRLDARSNLGPVIAAGSRWLLLTAPAGAPPVVPPPGDVLVHGLGSWIMLPPSLGPGGEPATWLARPRGSGWALPRRDDVLRLIDRPAMPSPRHRSPASV